MRNRKTVYVFPNDDPLDPDLLIRVQVIANRGDVVVTTKGKFFARTVFTSPALAYKHRLGALKTRITLLQPLLDRATQEEN